MTLKIKLNRSRSCSPVDDDQCFAYQNNATENPNAVSEEPTCEEWRLGVGCDTPNFLGKLNWLFNRLTCVVRSIFQTTDALDSRLTAVENLKRLVDIVFDAQLNTVTEIFSDGTQEVFSLGQYVNVTVDPDQVVDVNYDATTGVLTIENEDGSTVDATLPVVNPDQVVDVNYDATTGVLTIENEDGSTVTETINFPVVDTDQVVSLDFNATTGVLTIENEDGSTVTETITVASANETQTTSVGGQTSTSTITGISGADFVTRHALGVPLGDFTTAAGIDAAAAQIQDGQMFTYSSFGCNFLATKINGVVTSFNISPNVSESLFTSFVGPGFITAPPIGVIAGTTITQTITSGCKKKDVKFQGVWSNPFFSSGNGPGSTVLTAVLEAQIDGGAWVPVEPKEIQTDQNNFGINMGTSQFDYNLQLQPFTTTTFSIRINISASSGKANRSIFVTSGAIITSSHEYNA